MEVEAICKNGESSAHVCDIVPTQYRVTTDSAALPCLEADKLIQQHIILCQAAEYNMYFGTMVHKNSIKIGFHVPRKNKDLAHINLAFSLINTQSFYTLGDFQGSVRMLN